MSLDNFAALLVIAVLYGNQSAVRLDFPSLCAAATTAAAANRCGSNYIQI